MPDDHPRPTDAFTSPRFGQIATFMRLPHVASPAGLDVALYGIPFDGGCSYRPGARFGPRHSPRALLAPPPLEPRPPGASLRAAARGRLRRRGRRADLHRGHLRRHRAHPGSARWRRAPTPLCAGGDHSITLAVLRVAGAAPWAGWGSSTSTRIPTPGTATSGCTYFHGTPSGAPSRKASSTARADPGGHPRAALRAGGFRLPDQHGIRGDPDRGREGARRGRGWPSGSPGWPAVPSTARSTSTRWIPPMRPPPERRRWAASPSYEALALVRALAGIDLRGADVVEVSPPYDGPGADHVAARRQYDLRARLALRAPPLAAGPSAAAPRADHAVVESALRRAPLATLLLLAAALVAGDHAGRRRRACPGGGHRRSKARSVP